VAAVGIDIVAVLHTALATIKVNKAVAVNPLASVAVTLIV
jgi:hypothetical protein